VRKLFALVVVSTLAGCTAPADAPSDAAVTSGADHIPVVLTAQQEEGRVIYETMCWTCHGPAGRGDGPAIQPRGIAAPPTFHTEDFARSSAASLVQRFSASMDGADADHPHMQQVSSLLRPERFAEALAYVAALSYPPEIPGSAIAGKTLYEARCTGCHGPAGRGDGPVASTLVDVRPQDFHSDTLLAARNWDGVFTRIREGGQSVHGSSMPPWGILLSDPEIWDLVAYLSTMQPGLVSDPPWAD